MLIQKANLTVYLISCVPHWLLGIYYTPDELAFLQNLPLLLLMYWIYQVDFKVPKSLWLALMFAFAAEFYIHDPEKAGIGIGLFIFMHLSYIILFVSTHLLSTTIITPLPIFMMLLASAFLNWVLPHTSDLYFYVMVYVVLISIMAILAGHLSVNANECLWGAMCLILSAFIFGVVKFVLPLAYADIWISLFYYLGQYWVVNGMLKRLEPTQEQYLNRVVD